LVKQQLYDGFALCVVSRYELRQMIHRTDVIMEE